MHDSRHVLAGWGTTLRGEFGLAAFEAGVARRHLTDNVVAWFLHAHQEIPIFESTYPAARGTYDPDFYFREVARGARTDPSILNDDWSFRPFVERPLEELRAELGIGPGGDIQSGQPWIGPEAPPPAELPLDRATVLPATDAKLLALRVEGVLSAEDIEAFDAVLSRRCYGGKRIDLLIEVADSQEFQDQAARTKDFTFGFKHTKSIRRLAVVSDKTWQKVLVNLDRPFAALFGIKERHFSRDAFDDALAFCRAD